jgi:DNA-directed RNA polymerase subunit RPC12/RpoP
MFMTVCSTCGRRLNIPVRHLGAEVLCTHCGRHFLALTPPTSVPRDRDPLIARADAILALLE